MTPDTLRRAATLIRERAEKACTGDGETLSREWFASRDGGSRWDVVALDEGTLIAERLHRPTADHIASWHPAVALAAATWLEHEADRAEHQPWTDDVTEQALAFATAYLGEEME